MSGFDRRTILNNIEVKQYEDIRLQQDSELPEKVKECEKSVREDNPDMDKSTAIAICRDQLDMEDEGGCPSGRVAVGDDCVPIEEVDAVPSMLSLPTPVHLEEFDPETIERIEEGDDTVRYTNIKLIGPGLWTDSNSREQVWYSPEGMENLEVQPDNEVHIFHDEGNDVSNVGQIDAESATNAENGVFADIVLDTSTPAGQFADENMQQTLETNGSQGFGGPSVEIPEDGQDIEFNDTRGVYELKKGVISGLGLVKNPGAKNVHFARQTADAAVALSDAQSTMVLQDRIEDMSAVNSTELFNTLGVDLEDTDLDLEDLDLQDGVAIQDLIGLIAKERDIPADELMEMVSEMEGDGEGDGEEEGDEEEREEQEGEEDDEDNDEDGEEEEDEDTEMEGNEMEEMVQSLQERVQNLEDMVDSMMASEELEEALDEELEEAKEELADSETVQQLEEAKDELERRLEKLEEEPKDPKTLSDNGEKGSVSGKISPIDSHDRY